LIGWKAKERPGLLFPSIHTHKEEEAFSSTHTRNKKKKEEEGRRRKKKRRRNQSIPIISGKTFTKWRNPSPKSTLNPKRP
jgi:hypothetical protein